jgi:transposase
MDVGDGRSLAHDELERIRRRAVRRMMAGESAAEVAKSVGMSRSAVFAWKAKYLASGDAGLAAKPIPGRPPKMTEQQRNELYILIRDTGPGAHGFVPALWTRDLVRQLIEARFGVTHTIARIGVIMREMGLSPQHPKYRAAEQDEARVTAWREVEFPAIRQESVQVGARIYFGDESSVRSDHHAGTTWAPVGRTPVVIKTGDRTLVNMISAISRRGDIHFELTTGRVNSMVFIDFLKKLLHDDGGGRVFLVLDNSSIHTSKAVQKFVESTEGTLTLFFLPP